MEAKYLILFEALSLTSVVNFPPILVNNSWIDFQEIINIFGNSVFGVGLEEVSFEILLIIIIIYYTKIYKISIAFALTGILTND